MEQLTSMVSGTKRKREDQDTVKDGATHQRTTEINNEFPFDRDIVRKEQCTFCGWTNHSAQTCRHKNLAEKIVQQVQWTLKGTTGNEGQQESLF